MPTKIEFRETLERFSSQIDGQSVPSSHKNPRDDLDDSARRREDFWFNPSSGTHWRKPRTIAYLCSYVETFGPTFLAGAQQMDDGGSFVADVSVMKALLEGQCVMLAGDPLSFHLTPKGQALIEPFVHLDQEVKA